LIIRPDGTYETNSLFPDTDWYNEGNYVIDETKEENQELIQKIKSHAPHMELVVEGGKVIDIIPLEKPKPKTLIGFDSIDEEKLALAEAIIAHELEIQQLKAELASLKKGEE